MRHCSRTGSSASAGEMSEHRQDALIKRYQEIHFDYSTEFKNTSVSEGVSVGDDRLQLLTDCSLLDFCYEKERKYGTVSVFQEAAR